MSDIKHIKQLWKDPGNGLTSSEKHAYGEPSFHTTEAVAKAMMEFGLSSSDVLVDWGCGALKFIFGFVSHLDINFDRVLGIEMDEHVFKRAEFNRERLNLGVELYERDSSEISSKEWEDFGASVFLQYDGPPQCVDDADSRLSEEHRVIMGNILGAETTRLVFSTKLDQMRFKSYFETSEAMATWTCTEIPGLAFGGEVLTGFLWSKKNLP